MPRPEAFLDRIAAIPNIVIVPVDCRERSGWSACSDPAAFARANVLNEAFATWNASFRAIPFAPVLPWRAVKAASMTARAADVPQPPWWYSMRGSRPLPFLS